MSCRNSALHSRVLTRLSAALAVFLTVVMPAVASGQPALQKVTIILDWDGSQPHHMPYWLAKERGWFAEGGLDVRIQPGRGSGQVAQLVAAGQADFGQMTPTILIRTVAKQNVPLKMVGITFHRDTISLRYFRVSGIKTPKDLEGRTVGLVPGSVNDLLWPAFAKAAGFDASKVKTVGVDMRTYVQQFAAGQVDAANSALGSPENLKFTRAGKPVGEFVYSDYLPMVGFGIVVSHKTLADRPDVVQRFVKATQKGWEYLLRSPREAVTEGARIIKKNVEGAPDEDLILEASLQVVPSMMRSKGTEGKPAGWSNSEDWRGMIAMLQQYDQLPRTPSVDELMTNKFVE